MGRSCRCALSNLLFLLCIAATDMGNTWYEEEQNISRTFVAWPKLPMGPVVSMALILSPSKGGETSVNLSTVLVHQVKGQPAWRELGPPGKAMKSWPKADGRSRYPCLCLFCAPSFMGRKSALHLSCTHLAAKSIGKSWLQGLGISRENQHRGKKGRIVINNNKNKLRKTISLKVFNSKHYREQVFQAKQEGKQANNYSQLIHRLLQVRLSTRDPQTGTDEAQISRETDEVFKEHKHIKP